MMGTRHAAFGALLGAATLPLAHQVGAPPLTWVTAWVGGSLLPDLDMHTSTAARVWGWPTRLAGAILGHAAGGHRGLTHCIVRAPMAVLALGWAVLAWRPLAVISVAYILALALRMITPYVHRRLRNPVINLVVASALAYIILDADAPTWWAPLVIAVAVAGHIVADSLTNEGAPRPFARGDWGLRILTCGRGVEPTLGVLFAAVAAAAAWHTMEGAP